MTEEEINCECIICGKKYTLPLALIEDNFYTTEIFYCPDHVKEGNILKIREYLLKNKKSLKNTKEDIKPKKWEELLVNIGYEMEMKVNDDHYPINYQELLNNIHALEEELKDMETNKFNLAIMELCAKLDSDIYLPVKAELAESGIQHSLGIRKENFKKDIEQVVNRLK